MKLIKPYYTILNENDLFRACKEIELAARTCYQSEGKITEDSYKALIAKLIKSGHEAMLEFGPSITVKFVCDRGVSHELVRHRLCDFAQESTRYCNYSKNDEIVFITPPWIRNMPDPFICDNSYSFNHVDVDTALWMESLLNSEASYLRLLELGWQPQQARAVLPNSLKTEINMKANIREWRHIFRLRCSPKAHPQMRELMIPLLQHFQRFAPELFNDITYE
jgi:thymidylate synthase (FAD)